MNTKKLIYCALCVALNCIGGYVSIPIGTLPVTMQTFFAVMSGLLLGPVMGAVCQLIYIAMGLIGLPVFANGGSGIMYVLRPSFGYLIGFVFTSYTVGFLSARMKKQTPARYLTIAAIGIIPLYIIGVSYQMLIMKTVMNLSNAVLLTALAAIPLYIAGDIATLAVLSIFAPRLRSIIAYERKINR